MKTKLLTICVVAAMVLCVTNITLAATITVTALPAQVPDEAEAIGSETEYATGWATGCWQANGTAKTNYYVTPQQLFGRDNVTISELASISYWTKKDSLHTVDASDWYLIIYTKPYTGSPGSSWYGNRINSEPYFSESLNDLASTWNQWVADADQDNRLRFFDSSSGYYGSYTDPFLSDLTSNVDYKDQEIMFFVINTASGWAAGFDGYVDGLSIELTGGDIGNVNFEAVPVEVWVDDDFNSSTPGWGITHFDNIQDGIDAVASSMVNVAAGTYPEYLIIYKDGLTIQGAGIDVSIIDLDGLIPYWHYSGCSSSFASRAGVLISGWGSPDDIVENVTFKGFTVKNAGLNPPITDTGTHTGADDAATLTDSSASWYVNELVGQWVHNVSDKLIKIDISGNNPIRSYGLITANTDTTVTATLAGGEDNDWDIGDTYVVIPYEEYVDVAEDLQDDITGISIQNGKDIAISYCKSINNGSSGIGGSYARCVSAHKYSEGITIDHCTSSDNPRNGISIGKYVGAVTITNNTCSNNGSPHPTDPSRERMGVGITVSGLNSGNPISGVISDNICANSGFEGIVLKDYSDGVTIEDNTVTGSNLDQDGAGIFFYGKSSTPSNCDNHIIRNNTVTGNIRGIVAYYAQYCTIQGNTITTDSGAFALGQGGIKLDGANNMLVQNNILSSLAGIGIKVQNTWNDVESFDNTIMGNTITGAQFAGIPIWSGAHDNTFTNNTITGTTELTFWAGKSYEETQADGVFIDDDAGTGNVFHYNSIYGNAGDGMENQTMTAVDAICNWWGAADGPGPVGPGSGDSVSDYVDYDPWLSKPWFQISKAKIEVAKDKASVKGILAFNHVPCGGVSPDGNNVTVTLGPVTAFINGADIKVKDGKWEYKGAVIKKMKIDWTKGVFEFSMATDFSGLTNPVTISLQVGSQYGAQTVTMAEKDDKWEYKYKGAKKKKKKK